MDDNMTAAPSINLTLIERLQALKNPPPPADATPKFIATRWAHNEAIDRCIDVITVEAEKHGDVALIDLIAQIIGKHAPTMTHWTHYRKSAQAVISTMNMGDAIEENHQRQTATPKADQPDVNSNESGVIPPSPSPREISVVDDDQIEPVSEWEMARELYADTFQYPIDKAQEWTKLIEGPDWLQSEKYKRMARKCVKALESRGLRITNKPEPVSSEPCIKRLQSVRLFLLDKKNAGDCENVNTDDYGYQIAMIEGVLDAAGYPYVD